MHHLECASVAAEQGRLEDALVEYGQAPNLSPLPEIRALRGDVYQKLGRPAEAIADFAAFLAKDPGVAAIHLGKAACHVQRGEMEEFTAHVLRALELGDNRALDLLQTVTDAHGRLRS
jgi:tetratricopeptide (TPR) repeat protein